MKFNEWFTNWYEKNKHKFLNAKVTDLMCIAYETGRSQIKEQSAIPQLPQGEICSEFEYGKQCEACVNWVCGLQPCVLGRKHRPVR